MALLKELISGLGEPEPYKWPTVFTIDGKNYHVKKNMMDKNVSRFLLKEKEGGKQLSLQFENIKTLKDRLADKFRYVHYNIGDYLFACVLYNGAGFQKYVNVTIDDSKNDLKQDL